jgi:hypothetical protein
MMGGNIQLMSIQQEMHPHQKSQPRFAKEGTIERYTTQALF